MEEQWNRARAHGSGRLRQRLIDVGTRVDKSRVALFRRRIAPGETVRIKPMFAELLGITQEDCRHTFRLLYKDEHGRWATRVLSGLYADKGYWANLPEETFDLC